MTKRSAFMMAVMLGALVAGSCDKRRGEHDSEPVGTLRAELAVSVDDPNIQGVSFVITAADGRQYTNTVPLRRGDANATKPDIRNHVFADWLVVLPTGPYTVRATIIGANGQAVPGCSVGEGQVEVVANVTTEITLVVNCSTGSSGGLDTIVVVNHVPLIDQLTTAPNGKFICLDQAFAATLTAKDLDGDPLTWSFTVQSAPKGVVVEDYCLSNAGGQVAFSSTKAGQYTLLGTVSDGRTTSMLSFPVYVDPCGPLTCPGLSTGLALGATQPQASVGRCQCEMPVIAVNQNIKPAMPAVAPIDPAQPMRPVARYVSPGGQAVDFVASEVVVQTNDAAALNAFITRWNGQLLGQIDINPAGAVAPMFSKFYRVQIDASLADMSKAPALWAKYRVLGNNLFSSDQGMRAMAAILEETGKDARLKVSLNPVMHTTDFTTRSTMEEPTGPGGYTPDAYQWSYMNRASDQDIGTAEAWTFLSALGRLGNRVRIGIADGGFILNQDLPSDTFVSGPERVPNPSSCTGGTPCPWHGTQVALSAGAIPDNDIGVAGSAGPVAQFTLLPSPAPDFFAYLEFIAINIPVGLATGPRMINISASLDMPAEVCLGALIGLPACEVLNGITGTFRSAGVLLFAAAGNDGKDVDKTKTFGICPFCATEEEVIVIPCELNGVLCVGGLADNSNRRDSGSAFGSASHTAGSVDIYGPFTVFTINDPAAADDNLPMPNTSVRTINGTSFASPYVAGVAALIWAANPSLSANTVESLLLGTAHRNSEDSSVHRWVNALAAVMAAAGFDTPPFLRIVEDPFTVPSGATIELTAVVEELQGQPFTVFWRHAGTTVTSPPTSPSTITFDTTTWTAGPNLVEAFATDSAGNTSAVASVTVTVDAVAPPPITVFVAGTTTGSLCPLGPDTGDAEFNGGPDIQVDVSIRVTPDRTRVVARVDYRATEVNPGQNTEVVETFNNLTLFTAGGGQRILRIVSPTTFSLRFVGPGAGFTVEFPGCADGPLATNMFATGLVQETRIVGDTPGSDIAGNSGDCAARCNAKIENIFFRPIQLEIAP